jgi:hypothetical protein
VREAADALKIGKSTAARGFEDLLSHGFITVTRDSAFSFKLQQARRWRLTQYDCDAGRVEATKDFMRWEPECEKQNTIPLQVHSVPREGHRVSAAGH